jgi:hypothetical protein
MLSNQTKVTGLQKQLAQSVVDLGPRADGYPQSAWPVRSSALQILNDEQSDDP